MANNINNNNNQVHYFTPNVSVEDFQKILQSDASEGAIKAAAYAALANHTVVDLAKGLGQELVKKIKKFEKERNKEIREFVKKLNDFGNIKSDFRDDNENYLNFKEALIEVKKIGNLSILSEDEIKKIGSEAEKQSTKIENSTEIFCCAWNPMNDFLNAFSNLEDAVSLQDIHPDVIAQYKLEPVADRIKKTKDRIKTIIIDCLCGGLTYDKIKQYVVDHNNNRVQRENYHDPLWDLETFEEQFAIAYQEYPEIKAQQKAAADKWLKETKEQLLAQLQIVQSNFDQFKDTATFQQFSTEKQALIAKLQEIATFCLSKEILNHSKITQESKDRFDRMIKKL